MLLSELAATSAAVAATRSRTAKTEALTAAVAGLDDDELAAGLALLAGHPRQDRLGAGWAAVGAVEAPPADEPTLTVGEVDALLDEVAAAAGTGSQGERDRLLTTLWSRATADEQDWLRGVLTREVRQGASDSLVQTAIAAACDVPLAAVRRAVFLTDDAPGAALAARTGGEEALAAVTLRPLRFAQPMLAATAPAVREAAAAMGEVVVDVKLDGARVQAHRDGDEVRVFTRTGNDATERLPEVVDVVRSLDVDRVVLDGEAIALRADGTPRPFPETMGRFGTEEDGPTRTTTPDDDEDRLSVFFFDLLAASGGAVPVRDDPAVVDQPLTDRLALLDAVVPAAHRVGRLRSADVEEVAAYAQATVDARHEGVLLKDPSAPYAAGRRGSAWRKVKPVHTLDLVVLAVEWGSGRRKGWLSNLHLGAYDPEADDWVMLGRTFKGLTDAMLAWQTEHLLALEQRRTTRVVHVRPALVVEVALDGFVRSPRYPAGIAMRFARVKHHRPDKRPRDADTVATCRGILTGEVRPQLP